MDSIQQAIREAQNAAANISQEANGGAANLPAMGGTGTAVGAPMQKGAPLGFDDLAQGSLNVVSWLKVNEYGITIGGDKTLFDGLDVAIPLNEIAYCFQVRFGNPAQYRKTYDRITESRTGQSWAEAVASAQKVDPRAYEYRSADVPFYALDDITGKGGKVLVKRGEAVGHTLAVTGWKTFASFIKGLQTAGVDINNAIVKVRLGFEPMKNDKGEWGVLTYSNPEVIPAMPWEVN